MFHFTNTQSGGGGHCAEASGTEIRQGVVSSFEGLTASSGVTAHGDEQTDWRVHGAAGPQVWKSGKLCEGGGDTETGFLKPEYKGDR